MPVLPFPRPAGDMEAVVEQFMNAWIQTGGARMLIPADFAAANSAAVAAVTSPAVTSGVAFTPSTTNDATVYHQLAAAGAGSYTLTMGPSTGSENALATAVAVAIGAPPLISYRVPAGWKAILTVTTVTIAQTRVVTS